MDSSEQLELFDLSLYCCEQSPVNSNEQTQIELTLVHAHAEFKQLELELFEQQFNEILYEPLRLAA
jgi:hypothetical protein